MASIPHKVIGVAVICNQNQQILIARRLPTGPHGGLWEFPGGKLEPGETLVECIHREIREELGIEVAITQPLVTINHTYSDLQVTLHVYLCRHQAGQPQPLESAEVRWVDRKDLEQYNFPEANQQIIQSIQKLNW